MDLPPAEWVVAIVVGIAGWVGNKLWTNASDNTKKMIDATIGELRSQITTIVLTADPTMTPDRLITQLKGCAAILMAKAGLRVGDKYTNDVIEKLVDAAVAAGVQLFVEQHPAPKTLIVPAAKIAAATASL